MLFGVRHLARATESGLDEFIFLPWTLIVLGPLTLAGIITILQIAVQSERLWFRATPLSVAQISAVIFVASPQTHLDFFMIPPILVSFPLGVVALAMSYGQPDEERLLTVAAVGLVMTAAAVWAFVRRDAHPAEQLGAAVVEVAAVACLTLLRHRSDHRRTSDKRPARA